MPETKIPQAKPARKQISRKIAPKGKTAFGFTAQFENLINYFQTAGEKDEPWFQILNMLPIPIEVFAPDGTSIFSNRALIEFTGARDASGITGIYNLIKDPVCNDQLGMREGIQKVFSGEAVIAKDYPIPIQDLVDRGIIEEKPFEKATGDYLLYPVFKDDSLHFVVFVLIVRGIYFGRPDIARAKEYMDENWLLDFNLEKIAKAANLSVFHFSRLFKQHTGVTPFVYYKQIKIEKIKEKLVYSDMTIEEIFSACSVEYNGNNRRLFKIITGVTPTQYRKEKHKEE